jgi:hypothetical protein
LCYKRWEKFIVYNLVNSKQYIGQALKILSNGKEHGSLGRWDCHIREAYNHAR